MDINFIEVNNQKFAEISSDQIVVNTPEDVLQIMADIGYQGALGMILYEHNLNPDFFVLRTRLAGEILQKFSNYRMKLAIIGDFEKYDSQSLQAFIAESNRGRLVFFAPNKEKALSYLAIPTK